ncbi:M1 family metallopeptidase [Candidatus Saccharibacteria bacterium]|nr:M1 family metallopeptidase [Candidatus Saccharibacteria bacterium]
MSKNVNRLYKQFQPSEYDLFISLSQDKKSFKGKVTITGKKTGRPSKRITLHQNRLRIASVKLTHIDKKNKQSEIKISRLLNHKSLNELRIHTDSTIYAGNYTIEIEYSGTITDNMDGIYPCNFSDHKGDPKQLIATQFESHHARDAFPCIDEPEAKAIFKLSLEHSSDETAISNDEVESVKNNGPTSITSFRKTPIMSTYLLAFVVGELKWKEAVTKTNTKIRVYSVPDLISGADFALKTAVDAMEFYEDYYDIPFPLPKCDLVALPDFASGAMENWGLITFREQLLLCDKNTSLSTKQYIAIVVAHELTHQWFGNLVTMRWWTDLWLNEGFASWMEYLAVDHLFPEWHVWRQFTVDEQQSALKADSLEYTHPIEVEVHHPDEIRTIFDIISYQKGGSVIHMLYNYLGPDAFKQGLRHYLKKYAYSNASTTDLWQALEDVTGKPVKNFMGAWTSQSGYPIVDIEFINDHLVVKQNRFVTNPKSTERNDSNLWPIPLLCSGIEKALITKKITNIPLTSKEIPIKINNEQTGFYRVNYSHQLQQKQLQAIKKGDLDDIERMGLLSDSFEITRAGYQNVAEYLDLLQNYRNETSLAVWEIIASSLGSIKNYLSKSDHDEELRDLMKPFVRDLTKSQLIKLGWSKLKNESHLDSLLRPLIIGLSTSADEITVLDKCRELYDKKINDNVHLDPDLRTIVYDTIARTGGKNEYEQLLELYKKSTSNDEKLSLTSALTSFKQPEIIKEVLKLMKTDLIRLQDIGYWIAYSFMNRYSREATWKWLQANWDWLKMRNGTDLSFYRTPVYAARNFASTSHLEEYKEFFSKHMEPGLKRSYNQGLEIIETNNAWRERDSESALKWFKSLDIN